MKQTKIKTICLFYLNCFIWFWISLHHKDQFPIVSTVLLYMSFFTDSDLFRDPTTMNSRVIAMVLYFNLYSVPAVMQAVGRCTVTWLPNFLGWVNYHISLAQGPHSHILMTGGPTEVHILYPKKSQLQNLSTQKNPYFFSIPKKIPQCFCISKFYYLCSGKLTDMPTSTLVYLVPKGEILKKMLYEKAVPGSSPYIIYHFCQRGYHFHILLMGLPLAKSNQDLCWKTNWYTD